MGECSGAGVDFKDRDVIGILSADEHPASTGIDVKIARDADFGGDDRDSSEAASELAAIEDANAVTALFAGIAIRGVDKFPIGMNANFGAADAFDVAAIRECGDCFQIGQDACRWIDSKDADFHAQFVQHVGVVCVGGNFHMAGAFAASGDFDASDGCELGGCGVEFIHHDAVCAEVGRVGMCVAWMGDDGVWVWLALAVGVLPAAGM